MPTRIVAKPTTGIGLNGLPNLLGSIAPNGPGAPYAGRKPRRNGDWLTLGDLVEGFPITGKGGDAGALTAGIST